MHIILVAIHSKLREIYVFLYKHETLVRVVKQFRFKAATDFLSRHFGAET